MLSGAFAAYSAAEATGSPWIGLLAGTAVGSAAGALLVVFVTGLFGAFQALRIYVNNELDEIERALSAAESLLKPSARIVVVAWGPAEGPTFAVGDTRGLARVVGAVVVTEFGVHVAITFVGVVPSAPILETCVAVIPNCRERKRSVSERMEKGG